MLPLLHFVKGRLADVVLPCVPEISAPSEILAGEGMWVNLKKKAASKSREVPGCVYIPLYTVPLETDPIPVHKCLIHF